MHFALMPADVSCCRWVLSRKSALCRCQRRICVVVGAFPQEQLGTLHVQRRRADGAEAPVNGSRLPRGPAIRADKCVKCPATRTCISHQHICAAYEDCTPPK